MARIIQSVSVSEELFAQLKEAFKEDKIHWSDIFTYGATMKLKEKINGETPYQTIQKLEEKILKLQDLLQKSLQKEENLAKTINLLRSQKS